MKSTTAVLMALGLMLPVMTFAQDGDAPKPRGGGDRPGAREGGRGQMVPPLFQALDVNGDKVIDADEIKNAAEALKKLDKDGDGKITLEEMRPARPDGAAEGQRGNRGEGQGDRPQRRERPAGN